MKIIKTKDIKIEHVPRATDSIAEINRFAVSYDWNEKGNEVLQQTIDSNFAELDIGTLRCVLYCEQRRWNHFGRDYDSNTEKKIRMLIQSIREKLGDR